MAKFGSLEVRTFGKGKERITVAVFPGHEFTAEHFDPAKLERVWWLSSRVGLFSNKSANVAFVGKVAEPTIGLGNTAPLSAVNEAKIAMYANHVAKKHGFHDMVVDEPLAVSFKRGEAQVFYRRFTPKSHAPALDKFGHLIPEPKFPAREQLHRIELFLNKLRKEGVTPKDIVNPRGQTQYCLADDGKVHFFDVEFWKPTEKLKKQLKLRRQE
ncbi:MAG: hypothetical protein V1722_01910 [Candidatus Micrarchaeota archaeon]